MGKMRARVSVRLSVGCHLTKCPDPSQGQDGLSETQGERT